MVKVLEDASFGVDSGEIVAMIGPNGAGKSSALKAVAGLLGSYNGRIEKGEISFAGKSIIGLRTDELVVKGMSLVPEGRRVFPTMTVMDNLEMGAFIRKDKKSFREDMENVFALFPRLKERRKQNAGTLSTGEQQMLAIGRALILKPILLLCDEPSLGLSPNFVDLVFEKLVEINKTGVSILIVEQNAAMALEIAHRGYVFNIGKIVLDDSGKNLQNDEDVKKAFLGNQI